MTDDGHQIAVATRLRPEDAKAALGIVEGHPFDGAGEHRAVGLTGGQRRRHGRDYSACALEMWRARQME